MDGAEGDGLVAEKNLGCHVAQLLFPRCPSTAMEHEETDDGSEMG